jgi:hypothetical protein
LARGLAWSRLAAGLFGYEEQQPAALVADEVGDEAGQRHPALRVPDDLTACNFAGKLRQRTARGA